MSTDAAPVTRLLTRAAWACLALAVVAFLLPLPALAVLALGIAAGVLGLVAQLRGASRRGGAVLVAALVLTPLLFMLDRQGMRPRIGGSSVAGNAAADGPGANEAADASAPGAPGAASELPATAADTAMRTAVTAYELASSYAADAKAADAQYKGQRLLVTGMVAPGAADGPLALAAGDFAAVHVDGLAPTVRATLREGQQISMACAGAGMVDGAAAVDGCRME